MRDTLRSAAASLSRLCQALGTRLLDALCEQWLGMRAMQQLVHTAPLTAVGLLVILGTTLTTAFLSQPSHHLLYVEAELWEGNAISAPSLSLYFSLAVLSLGWAFVLVGAALASFPTLALVASYVSFYALSPGLSIAGSPWFVLIPIWILLLGGLCKPMQNQRWQLLLLGWLSLITAWITYPALGLSHVLPSTVGRVALAGLYTALAAGPWARRAPRLRTGTALVLTWLLLVTFYGYAALWSPPSKVLSDTFVAFHDFLGLLSLFWFWLGLEMFTSAQSTAWWLAQTLRSVVSERRLTLSILALWTLAVSTSYLLVHGPSVGATRCLLTQRWGNSLLSTWIAWQSRQPLVVTLHYWLRILLGVAALALIQSMRGKLSSTWLVRLFGLSLIALLVLYGHFQTLFSLASEDWEAALGIWPLWVFVGGMFWEVFRSVSSRVALHESGMLLVGLLLVFAAISLLELSAGYSYFKQELSLNPFVGAMYLGIPYVATVVLQEIGAFPNTNSHALASLFALGMLTAVLSLALERPLLAPLLWQLVTLVAVRQDEHWKSRRRGVIHVGAVAWGHVVFYTHPVVLPLPPLPFLTWLARAQRTYVQKVIWPWEAHWWGLMLAASASAALLGMLISHARTATGPRRVMYFILAPGLSTAFLAVCHATGIARW